MAGCWHISIGGFIVGTLLHAAQAGEVRVYASASIETNQVMLRDVCDMEGLKTPLPESVGETTISSIRSGRRSMTVTGEQIQAALRRSGVNMATTILMGSTQCDVTRADSPPVAAIPLGAFTGKKSAEQDQVTPSLRDAVVRAYQQLGRKHGGRVELQFGRTEGAVLELSIPDYRFEVHIDAKRWLGRISDVTVDVYNGEEFVKTVHLAVNAVLLTDTLVARGPINAMATIRREDVQVVERAHEHLDGRGIDDVNAVIGRRAKRFIREGAIIRPKYLEPAPLVKRGEIVEIISMIGGVQVQTAGKAAGTGVLGDVVNINIGDRRGRSLAGVVTGVRQVMIGHSTSVGGSEGTFAVGGQ